MFVLRGGKSLIWDKQTPRVQKQGRATSDKEPVPSEKENEREDPVLKLTADG